MKKYVVAVVGATGMVGREMMKVLEERNFPVERLVPMASERSSGKSVIFKGQKVPVVVAEGEAFKGVQIALFSPGAAISKILAPQAAKNGAVVIDNTSAFRMEPDIPLVVPEVNRHALKKHKGIIANPNCSTAQMVVVLKPIHDAARIKRIVVSTYQAVSGAGKEAVDELLAQSETLLAKGKIDGIGEIFEPKHLPRQIAFNVIPQIDVFQGNNYTKEEMKMALETTKIMEDDSIKVTATCVRVPVIIGHSEAVNIETVKKLTPNEVREILRRAKGVKLMDDPSQKIYPTPLDAAGLDDTLVGRIREDISHPSAIDLWIVSDNLRKGAALNAVQIAESLIEQNLL